VRGATTAAWLARLSLCGLAAEMLFSVFMLALRSVRRNMLRSFLTILGIVIGVSAVITMVTLGNGATQAIEAKITSLGTNLLMVSPGQRIGGGGGHGGVPQFIEADGAAIAAQIGGVAAVAPLGRANATVVANGRNWATSVVGSTNAWFETGNWLLASGRLFAPDEQLSGGAVCIVGETVRRELWGGTVGETGLGQQLRVKQFSCDVIGVLAAKGQGGMGDQDDTVVLPLHTLQRRVTGSRKVSVLMVSMQDGSDSAPLKASLRQLLRERRHLATTEDDNFNVFDTQQLADTLSSTMGVLTSLLGAVAAVSLLVGGIGIMNIMLVSVTERTREIGLRLAVGALEGEVLLQFLIEAVVLSALGGVVGVIIATAASIVLSGVMGVPYTFDPTINLLSLLFSAAIGVVFGYFPARRAARMDPIEALRHE
jgi:putative ABC transport system permease protein